MSDHDEPEGWSGTATVRLPDGTERDGATALVARFDPLAGRTVWTGRVGLALPLRAEVVVRTPHGEGRARAVEADVWGNTRVRGIDRPPFPVELLDATGSDG